MSGFDEQRTAITSATDALLARVQAPSDVSQAGVDFIRFLYGEIDRVKAGFKKNGVKLPLGKGGRGKPKGVGTSQPQPVSVAAE